MVAGVTVSGTMSVHEPPATGQAREGVVVEHVWKLYGKGPKRFVALEDVSLTVGRGEFVTVIGPSGCGKSTLLRIVAGLLQADAGAVSLFGETATGATAKKHVGFVPQSPALLPWRSVLDNVRLPLQVNRDADSGRSTARDPVDMLRSFGLGDVLGRYPAQLSGGMQQRVAIARAFVFSPALLIMDEPFAALDELSREAQRSELLAFWEADRRAVLFVTHSVAEAVALSDRIVVMSSSGRVRATLEVDLPRPRGEEVELSDGFHAMCTQVRSILRSEEHGDHV